MSTARRSRSRKAPSALPYEKTIEVRDRCLCLFVQRAARVLARRFDDALRPLSLTHGQFSLLTSLNRPQAPVLGDVAALLGMDRTTLTAALKSLQRRRLVAVRIDRKDKRKRRLLISAAGRAILAEAYPLWTAMLAAIEAELGPAGATSLRRNLPRLGTAAS